MPYKFELIPHPLEMPVTRNILDLKNQNFNLHLLSSAPGNVVAVVRVTNEWNGIRSRSIFNFIGYSDF